MGERKKNMERIGRKNQNRNHYRSGFGNSFRALWIAIAISACAVGCTNLKKATVTTAAAGAGAVVGTVISGGAIAPVAAAMTGAFVGDVTTEVLTSNTATQTIIAAPDNFFTILEKLVGIGGWTLVLVFIVPMVFGWIFPSPFERKKR